MNPVEQNKPVEGDQKVAIVTGGSQGIGAGLTSAYRQLGYAVVATSRSIGPSERIPAS